MSNRCCFILRIAFIRFYKWTLHVHHMYVTDKSPRLFTLNREYVPEKSWSESCTKPNGPSTWVHVYSLAFLSYCQHFSWRYFWLQHCILSVAQLVNHLWKSPPGSAGSSQGSLWSLWSSVSPSWFFVVGKRKWSEFYSTWTYKYLLTTFTNSCVRIQKCLLSVSCFRKLCKNLPVRLRLRTSQAERETAKETGSVSTLMLISAHMRVRFTFETVKCSSALVHFNMTFTPF